jgi:uncharacterized protein DUF2628
MRIWTVHTAPEATSPARAGPVAPAVEGREAGGRAAGGERATVVLVREGFSWAAFLFALPWLLWHRLWLAALLYLALAVAIGLLVPEPFGPAAGLALQFLVGAHANDLRRRRLARRGYTQAHVVAERDLDLATARLLGARPDLAEAWARASLA